MTKASWSLCGGVECIRLTDLPVGAQPQVRPASAATGLPPMAGRLMRDEVGWCFVPRFAFMDGTAYTVTVDGAIAATLIRGGSDRPDREPAAEVAGIYPTSARVPRNLLRFYVWFSAPMSEGHAAGQVWLADDNGSAIPDALLPVDYELWDPSRRRLTVLLDPARIKRGLISHTEIGYPLRVGEPVVVVVGSGFRDAQGLPILAGTQRRYQVGGDERRHVEPRSWPLTVPRAGIMEPVRVDFERPLDHGLLTRCLLVTGPGGDLIDGAQRIGPQESSWQFVPRQAWAPGPHQLIVDPDLEDLAGNSVSRVFDRDLARPEDQPRQARPVLLTFSPRPE
ncbi:MAG TPA: hypothetical protein VFI65_01105 [Streptosporangiaceae bacterium]|nr:hypothetical protein [Streptosporangiaceae bacterium]